MIEKQMKNEKGFTLIEMLLAMALGIVVLGIAIFTYNKQSTVLRTGNQQTETRGMARLAMDALVTNIQTAGYGLPPGDSTINDRADPPVFSPRAAMGISKASATSVTYRVNSDDITTFIAVDPSSSASNAFVVPLNSAIGIFAVNDQVVFFDVSSPANTGFRVVSNINSPQLVSGTNYDVMAMSGVAHGVELNPLRDSVPVMINKYHEITYTFNAGPQTITVQDDQGTDPTGDDTTTVIATNVTNLTFSYFNSVVYNSTADPTAIALPLDWATVADRPALGNIRRINIDITVRDQNETTVTTTLVSDVTLRNMGR
jgi:type II secretory pathway pseudopilin PulG